MDNKKNGDTRFAIGCGTGFICLFLFVFAIAFEWSALIVWLAIIGGIVCLFYSVSNQDDPEPKKSEPVSTPQTHAHEALQKKRKKLAEQGIVSCPRCGSTSIAGVRSGPDTTVDGYSWARELTGGCTVVNVCQVCGHRFYPGV